MSSNNTLFSGASRYAADFQAVIDRAVAIASLPLTQMQSARARLSGESAALGSLESKFAALRDAIQGLEKSTGLSSLAWSVSDGGVLKPALGPGAWEGSYSLEVLDLGACSSVMSRDGLPQVSDPGAQNISQASSYTLTVDGVNYTLTPAGGSLNDLAAAINAQTAAGVRATLVNVGAGTADYRLSLEGKTLGATAFQLNDGTLDLLDTAGTPGTSLVTGWAARYRIGSSPEVRESGSRTLTLSSGLTVEMLKESAAPVTVTVSRNSMAASNALAALTNAYNTAVDELDTHRGQEGGPLAGQGLVATLSQALRRLVNYSAGSGPVASLTDLGLEFDREGKLSFDAARFAAAASGDMNRLLAFLGSSQGGGFLEAAGEVLDGIEDSSQGSLQVAIAGTASEIREQDEWIEREEERIAALRESLQEQMAAADALIAALEQQALYFTHMFEAMAEANRRFQ
ncbi:MAG: flagellar filament capping protein FliD [Bryobacterales bacterium]|nr:flagellar filament capping protein FliD [Bryobacterales bacterium]